MQDVLLLISTIGLLAAGCLVPFVMALGYVWVDMFSPHMISESLLQPVPMSYIFGLGSVISYVVRDRREPPRLSGITIAIILLAIWITLTTTWAVRPDMAWWRWDLAIKMAFFATFLPYVIRSRVQIEALALVYLFCIAAHTVPWGLKTMLTGGGYNQALGLMRAGQSLLEESSVISAVCVMVVPFALVWRKHSILLPKTRIVAIAMWAIIVLSLIASIGTFARTALVAFAVCGSLMWLRSRQKLLFLVIAAVLGVIMFAVTSDKWVARVSTVTDYASENSAYVRILVWEWALNFVAQNPLGGGFWAYLINRIEVPNPSGGAASVQYARAWHNIFIAVLAEHGFPGFILYTSIIGMVLVTLQRCRRLTRGLIEHAWCFEFAGALQISIITLFAAGNFVEFGWTPVIWYLFSMSIALREYVRKSVEAPVVRYSFNPVRAKVETPGPILPGQPAFTPTAQSRR